MVSEEHAITVLITRPLKDAQEVMRILAQKRIRSLIDPMLHIIPVDCPPLILKDVQALVATSLNGIRRLCQLTLSRHLPLYVVGKVSAQEAHQMGFNRVYEAQGSVESLLALLKDRLNPYEGKILYITGEERRGDLVQILSNQGYKVERIITYKALPSSSLKPETQEAIITGRLNAILFFSPRTSQIFVKLTKVYAKAFEHMIAVCMSPEVANPLRLFKWKEVLLAQERSGQSMVEVLENYYRLCKKGSGNDTYKKGL
jgi:uroporphyrinogen-III synthase